MQINRSVRIGTLALVCFLAAGLVWLGLNRYWADQRAQKAAVLPPAPESGPASPAGVAPASQVLSPAAETPATKPEPEVLVHVAGAVARPGVYKLPAGARVSHAIEAAGGALPEGVPDSLNLASPVNDGEKVFVATKQELETPAVVPPAARAATQAPPAMAPAVKPSSGGSAPAGKVNVNTATAAQLDQLPSISPTVAKAIVDYRAKNGPFKRVEDLDKVTGIGPSILEKLRPLITL